MGRAWRVYEDCSRLGRHTKHAPTGTRTCSRYAVDRGSWRTNGELDKGLHARKARKIGSKDGRPRMTVSVSADLSSCRRRAHGTTVSFGGLTAAPRRRVLDYSLGHCRSLRSRLHLSINENEAASIAWSSARMAPFVRIPRRLALRPPRVLRLPERSHVRSSSDVQHHTHSMTRMVNKHTHT